MISWLEPCGSTGKLGRIALICALTYAAACGGRKVAPVEDLSGKEDLSRFALFSLGGTRDGDRLDAQAAFSDSSSMLLLEMRFTVGVPTSLKSGTWRWTRNNNTEEGTVVSKSVTFLGGQSGAPSLGGTFELLDAGGGARYRVNIPVTELRSSYRR